MPDRNVSLPESLDLFIDDSVKSSRYDNASEVVCAGLRRLRQEEKENLEKLAWLKKAIAEGIASGSQDAGVVFAELEEFMDELAAEKAGSTERPASVQISPTCLGSREIRL